MRRLVALAAFATAATALAAATLPAGWKMNEPDAQERALDALVGGQVDIWILKPAWAATPLATRAALVQGGLEWTKAFAATPVFAAAYADRRAAAKPEPMVYEKTIDQELAADRAKQKQDMVDFKAQIKQMPPDQQKAMQEMAKSMEAQTAQMAADPQLQAALRQGKEIERAERKKNFDESLVAWQKDWPADPKPLIATRLKAFLAACGDVDFAAKLIHDPQIGKERFAETRYEMKSAEWKLCYRAGKAPVDAARAFAQNWLKELPTK